MTPPNLPSDAARLQRLSESSRAARWRWGRGRVDPVQRAREEAEDRARLLRIAVDAARSMATLGTGVLDAAVEGAIQLGFDAGVVCVLDEEARTWRLERAVNIPASYVESGQAADLGVMARVRDVGQTIVVEDYGAWDAAVPEVRDGGYSTIVGVPIRVRGELV